jgi:hypothetical protein
MRAVVGGAIGGVLPAGDELKAALESPGLTTQDAR